MELLRRSVYFTYNTPKHNPQMQLHFCKRNEKPLRVYDVLRYLGYWQRPIITAVDCWSGAIWMWKEC